MGTADLRRRVPRWVLAVSVVAVTTVGLATPARADNAFTLSSMAEGVSVVISNASIPLITSVQVNTPMAQANLNSRGQGSSYSAAPDPGQDVAELPATGSAEMCAILVAYGLKLPGCALVAKQIPAYPYAYAQSGDPPQDRSFAAAHMHAEATQTSSEAQTVVGASGATSAVSTARTAVDDIGRTSSSADTSVDAVQFGTYVELAGIHAVATAIRDTSGHLALSSSFQIGHLTVDGRNFGYDDGKFVLLGTPIPIALPAQQVLSMLKAAGITATFLPATKTKTGITSEGLMLSYTIPGAPSGVVPPIPLPLPIGVGVPTTPTTVTYVLGRAQVASSNQAIGGFNFGGLTGTLGGMTTPPSTGTLAGGTPALSANPPATSPNLAPPTNGSPAAPTLAAATQRKAWTSDSADIYLAFVVTALAIFGAATAVRLLGVRLTWTS
jgi:hypothetical protein